MAKELAKSDTTYLKRYSAQRTLRQLAERFEIESATLVAELKRLELTTKDGQGATRPEDDPMVKVFKTGFSALQKGKWAEAAKQFKRVLAGSDRSDLSARARQYLRLTEERRRKPPAADEDPFLLAVFERNQGNLDAALELCKRGGRQSKDERFAYLAASIYSLQGDADNAGRYLALAIEMNPKNRIHAHFDRDFEQLRQDEEHAELFAIA